jgi:hypothetical protein
MNGDQTSGGCLLRILTNASNMTSVFQSNDGNFHRLGFLDADLNRLFSRRLAKALFRIKDSHYSIFTNNPDWVPRPDPTCF